VVKLLAQSPVDDLLPAEAGAARLVACQPAHVTAIAPWKGREAALSEALEAAHGARLPASGRSSGKAAARVIWTGYRQYMLLGDAPADAALAAHAALTDVSDGWVAMRLEGADAEAVLARLTPLDLDPGVFKRGHVARTELAHMMAVLHRTPAGIEIMVMRSFARWAAGQIRTAMQSIAAQRRIAG